MRRWVAGACLGAALWLPAQTVLGPGDIAIIAHNFDDGDQLVFVALTEIAAGTNIKFTDNGWTGSAFASSEGVHSWTANASLPRGSVVTLQPSGMSLAVSGDQVFAFQGSLAAPALVYGLSTTPWLTTGSITNGSSYCPAVLQLANAAIAYPLEMDNGYYNILSSKGDKAHQLALLADPGNRATSNSRYGSWPTWSFDVLLLAAEPAAQPNSLLFSNVVSYRHQAAFNPATPAVAGYLVLRRRGAVPTASPADGTAYLVGDDIGDAKVAYVGTASSFAQEGTAAGTTYGYAVFAFNGAGNLTNYLQAAPLAGLVTTPATGMGAYYGVINPNDVNFIGSLQQRIRAPYTRVTYDNFDETNIARFASTDASGGRKSVTCVYTGQAFTYNPPLQWYTSSPFSREHTFCHSWMPSHPSTTTNEYSDQHHLFPVNQTTANAVRSNHPLGEVATMMSASLGGTYGRDAAGDLVYLPRPEHRGDAARALLYMSLRYNGLNGLNWTFDHLNATTLPALGEGPQRIATLLSWHRQDPPDAYEIARNDYIQSIQGNRNPFVDHPEWTGYINFGNLTPIPVSVAAEEPAPAPTLGVHVAPDPLVDRATLTIEVGETAEVEWRILDEVGRLVRSGQMLAFPGVTDAAILHAQDYAAGMYVAQVIGPSGQATTRFMVE